MVKWVSGISQQILFFDDIDRFSRVVWLFFATVDLNTWLHEWLWALLLFPKFIETFPFTFYLKCIYLLCLFFIWKWTETAERKRKIPYLLVHSSNANSSRAGAVLNLEPSTQSVSPMWLSGPQLLESTPLPPRMCASRVGPKNRDGTPFHILKYARHRSQPVV